MTNFVEEPTKQTFDIINSNESESDLTEEDYWYSAEQDRYKEQLEEEQLEEEQLREEQLEEEQLEEEELRDYEDSEEKEYYKYYYGDLKEENMSKKEHEFILYITENIIRECAETELDYESVEKMTYNIYPRVCALFNKT